MTFLNPMLALTGLACVLVPILIHLLMRRRRRPVEWGAMKFLLEAYRRQRRRMNLEQLLLLGARCLLVAVLALALGRPVLGSFVGGLAQGPRTLFLLVDNSLASSANEPGGESGLARSKAAALTLLDQLDPARGDRAALMTLGGPADAVILPPSAEFGSIREHLADLTPTDSRGDLAGALARLADDVARDTGNVRVAILSDFRSGSFETNSPLTPGLRRDAPFQLVVQPPATTSLDNVAITALEPLRRVLLTGMTDDAARVSATFRVHLRRFGPCVASSGLSKVRVSVGMPASEAPDSSDGVLRWSPGQTEGAAMLSVSMPPRAAGTGRLIAVASIDRDAVAGDNTFRVPLDVRGRLEVALLAEGTLGGRGTINAYTPADWLAIALAPETDLAARRRQAGELRLSVIDPVRPSTPAATGLVLTDADAIIIPNPDLLDAAAWDLVRGANIRGAMIVVFPPPLAQTHLWTDAFLAAMGLDWSIERTPRDVPPGVGLSPLRQGNADVLAFVAPELGELVKPVAITRVLPISASPGAMGVLLALNDGTPVIATSPPTGTPRGLIVCFSTAMHLAWTDLPTKPLMVPLLQELVRQGVGQDASRRDGVAGASLWVPATCTELLGARGAGATASTAHVVAPSGAITPPVRHGGVFTARGANARTLALLAVNADTAASSTEPRSRDDTARWLADLGSPPTFLDSPGGRPPAAGSDAGESSNDIAFQLLLAALALAVVEAFFGRWFSHASAGNDRGDRPSPARG
ncbi:MAG: hypothetical protein HBSAPP03_26290 [Phycisphaerae bacterium]|nr:MAG: hypothetical protein HBSAPP03_26290 [Phycisphaerae bacterium]